MIHALTAALLSAGIVMSLLGVMDPDFPDPGLLLISALVIALFELVSIHRVSSVAGAIAALTGAAVWAFSPSGARQLSDLTIAVSLRIRGIDTALPLIAGSAKTITTCLITLLCCLACIRKATCLPATVLCLAAAMLVWLTNRTDLIPWLLPALIAMISLLLMSRYPETKYFRVIPWSAGIVCLAYLLAGNGASVPAMREKADEWRRSVMDRLFFTEPRDVFSLYTAGYSPQGPDQLGGKPNPSGEIVMTVSAPKTVYLRGTPYDEYTGRSWQNTAGGRRYLWESDRMEKERAEIFDMDLPPESIQNSFSKTFSVTVRMESGSTSTLFVPQRIRELIPGSDMVPYYSNSSEIFITRNLKSGDTYSFTAPLYTADDPGIGNLIEICGQTAEDSRYERIPDIYFSLPPHLEPSLKTMALDITRDAGSPFEKALMIQRYLKDACEYTTDVDDQQPGYDFVTTFLLTTRKGYCTYFASAMTVLCRMNGLPARYVEGYLAKTGTSGSTTVTGEDAHAWTEVYFEGYGWLTFDATPGIRDNEGETSSGDSSEPENTLDSPPDSKTEPQTTPSPTITPAPTTRPSETPEPSQDNPSAETTPAPTSTDIITSPPPAKSPANTSGPQPRTGGTHIYANGESEFPWLVIPLLLAFLLILRIILTSPSVKERFSGSESKKAQIWIQETADLLAAEHIVRKKGETLLRFTERADHTGFYSVTLRPVGEAVSMMAYSCAEISEEETNLIRDTAIMLRAEISRPARARYWVRRIFRSVRSRDWKTMK